MDVAEVERNIVVNVLTYDLCGGNYRFSGRISTYCPSEQVLWQNFIPICL